MGAHAKGGWLLLLVLLPSAASALPGPDLPLLAWSLDLDLAQAAGVAMSLAGDTFVAANSGGSMVVWMVDPLGQPAWAARMPGVVATGVAALPDGGAVVSGYGWGDGPDARVLAFGRDGVMQWDRGLGTPGADHAWGVAADARSILVAGSAGGEASATALDPDGAIRWTRHSILQPEQRFAGAAMLPDGGAVLAGWTYDGVRNRVLAARFSLDGQVVWQELLSAQGGSLRAHGIATTPDGAVLLAGVQAEGVRSLPLLARLDGAGRVVWQRTYGVASGLAFTSIATDALGGAAVGGTATDPSGGSRFVARMTTDGLLAWSQRLDDADAGSASPVALHPAGMLSAAGTTGGYLVATRWLDAPARPR